MDTQPQRDDANQAVSAWLASEAFTDFMTLTFGVAVKQVVDEQVAKGVIQSR